MLAVWWVLCAAVPQPLHAQAGVDTEPPSVRVDPLAEAPADQRQVFTARVSDNRSLERVRLHHRREGEQRFATVPMRALGSSGFYSVTIATDPADLRPIEYYFEARDAANNRTVSGFSFDPYRRTLAAPTARAERPVPTPTAQTSRDRPNWWMIALGVLAAGAVIAAASDSDDGGGMPAGPGIDEGVPLTLEIQEP